MDKKTKKVIGYIEDHEKALINLKSKYDVRFDQIEVNKFGEVNAEQLLELNKWYEREKGYINRVYTRYIKEVFRNA